MHARTGLGPAMDTTELEHRMNSAYDRRLQELTCIAFTRSPAVARREQARILAEIASAIRSWARAVRVGYRHAGAETG